MMRFPKYFIERLRSQLALSEIVGRHVVLKRHGREFQALCPFHKEKTPSFTVSNEKGFYHCFGCGAHGDAIKFVMETQGMSYPEAVEMLAVDAGLPIPEMSPEEVKKERRMLSLYDVTEQAAQWFEQQLQAPIGREVREYLQQRGIRPEIIQRFRLGFAPDSRDAVQAALLPQGITERQLLDAGLIIRRDDGSNYSRFRGRVMFPITDARGRVIAFGGRTLSQDKKVPKYLNSPETELFHKGELLYHFAPARRAAQKSGEVIVGEGYMDVIAMAQAGIDHAVAPLGTAVTDAQLRLLWQMADAPVFCLDGDAAGERAMERAAELAMPLLQPGKTLRFAFLPEGEDPDSLLRYRGKRAFDGVLRQAPRLSQMLWDSWKARIGVDTPEKKAALEDTLMQLVGRIAHPTVQVHFKSFFREQLWARKQQKGKEEGASSALLQGLSRQRAGREGFHRFERQMVLLLLLSPELWTQPEVEESVVRLECSDRRLDALHGAMLDYFGQEGAAPSLHEAMRAAGYSTFIKALEKELYNNWIIKNSADRTMEEAREIWQSLWEGYTLARMQEESLQVEADLAMEVSESNLLRLTELQRQMAQLRRHQRFASPAEEAEV